jgi:transcriptional regulator with XRE-family HTH domain
MVKAIGRTAEEANFWSLVDITGHHWFYTGDDLSVDEARAQSWGYTYAPVLPEYFLEVWCGEGDCIRPQHTFIGKLDHVAYAVKKRREERSGDIELTADLRKKLTDEDCEDIRQLAAKGMSQSDIGRLFGVTRVAIHYVLSGKRRKRRADPETGRIYFIDKEEYMTSKEKRQEYWQRYYEKHRDEIIARIQGRRNDNLDEYRAKQRMYRARNKEKFLDRERQYYLRNREHILERKRESQRLRSKATYWKGRDVEKYKVAMAELDAYLEKRKREEE